MIPGEGFDRKQTVQLSCTFSKVCSCFVVQPIYLVAWPFVAVGVAKCLLNQEELINPSAAAGKCAFLTLWVGIVCSLTFNTHGVDCNSKSELSLAVMRSNLDEGTYGDTFLDVKLLLSAWKRGACTGHRQFCSLLIRCIKKWMPKQFNIRKCWYYVVSPLGIARKRTFPQLYVMLSQHRFILLTYMVENIGGLNVVCQCSRGNVSREL